MQELDRYSRQTIFPGIGPEGQRRLLDSYAVVVGCGALGTVIASALVRAGVGRVRVIDRDFIETHNLQRQLLFTEDDIAENLPKAVAAERHLRAANPTVLVEGVVADFSRTNAEELVAGANVILDGLDNFETRFLINDVAYKHGIPWVYGGAIGSSGMTATFLPGERPCFRCVMSSPPVGGVPTCDTAGVVNVAPWIVGSLEAAEALKILVGSPAVSRDLVVLDVWQRSFERLPLSGFAAADCPTCAGNYEFLQGRPRLRVTSLCGQNAVQIWHVGAVGMPLSQIRERLEALGPVEGNEYMVRFPVGEQELVVFYDGRTIVRGTRDEKLAKALYAKYVGM
ncbi:MAG: ThiF family adenylyltransferase [Thermoleophilia bacterium]|nr:ThiF family adenylyltransferase [Thermoleophilia bacterium]